MGNDHVTSKTESTSDLFGTQLALGSGRDLTIVKLLPMVPISDFCGTDEEAL